MKQKLLSYLSFCLSLTGCTSSIEGTSYRCYLGKMMVSSFVLPKDEIIEKEIQTSLDGLYFANMYFLTTQSELNAFYEKNPSISKEEKEQNKKLKETLMIVYFIIDTPKGYKAYKRDNIQGTLVDQGLCLLTDNFYYYANRPDMFYCQIDFKKEENITNDGTYSFYYVTSSQYKDLLKAKNIRLLFSID